MAVCPICQSDFDSILPGRLCDRCAADVIARDTYQPGDLMFVGILSGVLGAAIFSMPGAFLGYYLGRVFDQATNGCLAGVILMSLVGIVVGYIVGRTFCVRMEEARRRNVSE